MFCDTCQKIIIVPDEVDMHKKKGHILIIEPNEIPNNV